MFIVNLQSTDAELVFLKRLGRWSEIGATRRELLERYLHASAHRELWDGIDAPRVRAYASMLLHTMGD